MCACACNVQLLIISRLSILFFAPCMCSLQLVYAVHRLVSLKASVGRCGKAAVVLYRSVHLNRQWLNLYTLKTVVLLKLAGC